MTENGDLETYVSRFRDLLKDKTSAALFTHIGPDPDGLGSMMGIKWLFNHLNIHSQLFYDGPISHPQNIAMTNLLDPGLRPLIEYNPQEFDVNILLDTIPSYAGVCDLNIKFDVIIDHHKEHPNNGFNGIYINLKAGSCCATVYELIRRFGLRFEDDNEYDSHVSTGMLVGIAVDTDNLMSDDTTECEFRAWKDLFEFKDTDILKKIVNYSRPKAWVEAEAEAVKRVDIKDGVAIVGLGLIPQKHRDMIADMAGKMVQWEDVNTAIAFAIVNGERIEGSVRSNNASVIVTDLCKKLGGKYGDGGGKLGKGAYRYNLGGGAIDEEDDDDIRTKLWEVFSRKEEKRILRAISS